MLTLVEVNHHALLAELSTDLRERAYLNRWASLCAAAGSLTSLLGHLFWARAGSLWAFRIFALFVALGALFCFEFSSFYLRKTGASKIHNGGKVAAREEEKDRKAESPQSKKAPSTLLAFTWALREQKNFVVFSGVSALQTFDCALGKQFFTIFLELLVGDALGSTLHALIVTSSFLLPWLSAAAFSRRLEKTSDSSKASLSGTLRSIWHARLGLLLVTSANLAFLPADMWASTWARRGLGAVILANRVMSECVCRLVPLVESDLIDEHRFIEAKSGAGNGGSMGATLVRLFFSHPQPTHCRRPCASALADTREPLFVFYFARSAPQTSYRSLRSRSAPWLVLLCCPVWCP